MPTASWAGTGALGSSSTTLSTARAGTVALGSSYTTPTASRAGTGRRAWHSLYLKRFLVIHRANCPKSWVQPRRSCCLTSWHVKLLYFLYRPQNGSIYHANYSKSWNFVGNTNSNLIYRTLILYLNTFSTTCFKGRTTGRAGHIEARTSTGLCRLDVGHHQRSRHTEGKCILLNDSMQ